LEFKGLLEETGRLKGIRGTEVGTDLEGREREGARIIIE
jgi:hypothetical protein